MRHRLFLLAFTLIAGAAALPAQTSDLVDTDLAERMVQLFPELSEGYIDLNANGSLDRFQDMDEQIPESMIQDQTLQVQEVLDFILANFRFFSVERLQELRAALEEARGDIPEIIAISYRDRLAGAIEDKRELDDEGLYLPPSVMARAQEEMAGYIATMVHSFRKEEEEYAEQFERARERLFSMMEAGYPLPNISDADESLLSSAMIHTIATTARDDPARVKAAIRTLGRLQSEQAIPQLTQLLDSQEFRVAAAEALGEIGTNTTRNILTTALERSAPGPYQNALIRAVGRVGGSQSAQRIISLAGESAENKGAAGADAQDKMLTVLKAMVDLTKQGNRNRELYQTMSSYLADSDPAFRRVAAEGIAAYGGRNALGLLQPRLQEEENEDVLVTLVRELRAYDEVSVLSNYTSLLGEPSTSVRVRREIIQAIGAHANGERVVTSVMEYLNHESDELRDTASETLSSLYQNDARAVVGSLSRQVTQSDDPRFLSEATELLAELADPAALTALLNLLGSPHERVRENASWGLYRIRPSDNVRVVTELQKLVNSEAEPIQVRINAVRALGAMGYDAARLEVDKTLATTLELRAPEYVMLRYFAARALAELPELDTETTQALLETAASNEPPLIRSAAISTLRDNGVRMGEHAGRIASVAQRAESVDVKLAALELLGDMGAADAVGVARSISETSNSQAALMKSAYAVSKIGTEDAISVLIDLAAREDVSDLAYALLLDTDRRLLSRVVTRRLQTEDDEAIRDVLEQLEGSVAVGN
jgi:HEAT repeat protein